jgi:hypothetical protein
MTRHLGELQKAGQFQGDVEKVGHMHWAAVHGCLMLELSGLLPPHLDAATLSHAMMSAMDASALKA